MPKPLRDASGKFLKAPSKSNCPEASPIDSVDGENVVFSDVDSDVGIAAMLTQRKRPSSSFVVPGHSESDTETEATAGAKVSTARRGRGRNAKAGPSREDFLKPSPVCSDNELEKVLMSRAFKKGMSAKTVDSVTDTGSDSEVAFRADDLNVLNAQELRAQAGGQLACILEVARKSGNLKGEYVGRLKRSASLLRDVVDLLAGRSEAEETRRLRGDNSRLRLEIEAAKAEIKALRRGFSEAKADAAAAAATAAAASSTAREVAPATVVGVELVEELKRSLVCTVGEIISARLAGIEDRLLPAPTVRPPLRADLKKRVAAAPPKATPAPPKATPAPAATAAAAPAPPKKAARKAPKQSASVASRATPSTSSAVLNAPTVAAPSAAVPQADTWATVVSRGKGKGKGKKSPPAPAPVPAARAPATTPQKKKKSSALTTPKSAVVVLSLQPEAVGRGVTFSAVIEAAQEKVDIHELGIDQLRFRQTATGARKLEIPGSGSAEKADRLAEKLREALSEVATVSRPHKSADLDVTGLDDAATKEKVAAAIAKAGGCDVGQVKAGDIRRGPGGVGASLVSCPVAAAKAVLQKGRLLIGWSSVRVKALEARPLRCFKCLGLGHTRPQCPASADRGDLCFRCGGTGHKAAACAKNIPRCAICAESGRPSAHVMGGRSCAPPKTKGSFRTNSSPAAAPSAAAPAVIRPAEVIQEVVMSE